MSGSDATILGGRPWWVKDGHAVQEDILVPGYSWVREIRPEKLVNEAEVARTGIRREPQMMGDVVARSRRMALAG